jgi:hypothetical protein
MVSGVYKAPLALLTAGYHAEARLALDYIKGRFLEGGDFNNGFCDLFMPLLNNYRNAWLTWGAYVLNRPENYGPGADYLESCINPTLGGLPGRREYHIHESIMDWGCSALGTVALSKIGRLSAACECARFLDDMLDSQPEPDKRLYLRKSWDGKLYHLFPSHMATDFVIEFQKPDQVVWYFGAAMAGLGYLYQATSDSRWLNAAVRIFNLTQKCQPNVYTLLTSAKIGWGCSVLYTATGDPKYADTMIKVADHVVETQEREGGWVRYPIFSDWESQPMVLGLDVSLERTVWLNMMAKSLSAGLQVNK